jgi:hypothetical protein
MAKFIKSNCSIALAQNCVYTQFQRGLICKTITT